MATTTNPFKRFQRVLGVPTKTIATVIASNIDGTSLLEARNGQTFLARGSTYPANSKVWVIGDEIISEAPDLPVYQLFI